MIPRAKGALLAALTLLLVGSAVLHPAFGPATLAFYGDAERAFARFTGDVPMATCAVFWATSRTANDALKITGQTHLFNGCLHSNRDFNLGGGTNTFNRTIRHANLYYTNDNAHLLRMGHVQVPAEDYPFPFVLSDYAPNGCKARAAALRGEYFSYAQSNAQIKAGNLKQGLHYVQGSATVDLTGFSGTITVVATGGIKVSTDAAGARAHTDGLLFFANAAGPNALSFVGNGGRVVGAMYAPNGEASYSAQANHYTGQVVGDTVTVSGSNSVFNVLAPVGTAAC